MYGVTPAIVLYAGDPVVTRQFYETIGLVFVEERHDGCPPHYSCDLHGVILEIYPLRAGTTAKPCNTVALVIFVDAIDRVVDGLKAMGGKPGQFSVYAPASGLRAVNVRDPEGLLVRLLERDPLIVQ